MKALENAVAMMRFHQVPYEAAVEEFKRQFMIQELASVKWNQCAAARKMGMHRNTIRRTMRELGIEPRVGGPGRPRIVENVEGAA